MDITVFRTYIKPSECKCLIMSTGMSPSRHLIQQIILLKDSDCQQVHSGVQYFHE